MQNCQSASLSVSILQLLLLAFSLSDFLLGDLVRLQDDSNFKCMSQLLRADMGRNECCDRERL